MKLQDLKKELKPLDIVIFHVGGVGDYGPVEYVVKDFAEHVVTVCFEANVLEGDYAVQEQYSDRGVRAFLIPRAVGDVEGKQSFCLNKHSESSSLFPPSPQALNEHGAYGDIHTWRENCELDRKIEVDVTTLDSVIKENNLPSPDIVSLDAQGAELRIMQGGKELAMPHVLGVVSEVEFWEIYEGQDLFCEQLKFLSERGFRLAEMFNTQRWHPAPALGKGFLTMGEALFLRDANKYRSKLQASNDKAVLYEGMKLAAIAYSFRRLSYAAMIVKLLLEKFGKEAESLFLSHKRYKPLLDLERAVVRNHKNYLKDARFFYKTGWRRKGLAKLEFLDALRPLLKGGPLAALRYIENIIRDILRHILFWRR